VLLYIGNKPSILRHFVSGHNHKTNNLLHNNTLNMGTGIEKMFLIRANEAQQP